MKFLWAVLLVAAGAVESKQANLHVQPDLYIRAALARPEPIAWSLTHEDAYAGQYPKRRRNLGSRRSYQDGSRLEILRRNYSTDRWHGNPSRRTRRRVIARNSRRDLRGAAKATWNGAKSIGGMGVTAVQAAWNGVKTAGKLAHKHKILDDVGHACRVAGPSCSIAGHLTSKEGLTLAGYSLSLAGASIGAGQHVANRLSQLSQWRKKDAAINTELAPVLPGPQAGSPGLKKTT